MKRLLIVSFCPKRGASTGITGKLLDSLKDIDKDKYEVSLYDTNFFDVQHNPEDYPVAKYFALPKYWIEPIIRKIPYVRSRYSEWLIVKQFKLVMTQNHFDLVALYNIPVISNRLIDTAHKNSSKVIMYPWGSDILVAQKFDKKRIQLAFEKTDFVGGASKSNCSLSAERDFGVPVSKFRYSKQYVGGVAMLQGISGTKTRLEMQSELHLPESGYNIVCGYNGYATHRHHITLDAIIANKSYLPADTLLIFPMTYGLNEEYMESLKNKCDANGLKSVFLTEFMPNEKMAYLHLITDLFINVQDSDCGNAFMIEALFAENRIITGRWLKYEQFEQFGDPYILIDKPEDLSNMLQKVFTNSITFPQVPSELHKMFEIPADYTPGSYWTNILDTI